MAPEVQYFSFMSRTLLGVGLLLVAAAAIACGGVTASDLTDTQSASQSTSPGAIDSDGADASAPTNGGDPTDPTKPGDPGTKPDPTPAKDGGPPAPPVDALGCAAADMEKEPNDTFPQANPIAKVFCGQIGAPPDNDWAMFDLPDEAKSIEFKVTTEGGDVQVQVAAGNRGPADIGDVRVRPGETYRIWVRGRDGKTPKYRIQAVY